MADNNIVTLEVPWGSDVNYKFRGKLIRGHDPYKWVYIGSFVEKAPAGLTPGAEYCLKQINFFGLQKCPQLREYYELVPFKGDHLRELKQMNANARCVADALKRGETPKRTLDCYVVEPAYRPALDLFQRCSERSVIQRLEIIRQCALGCQELQSPDNKLGGRAITAHRDMKRDNVVNAGTPDEPHICLIDFSSIKLEQEAFAPKRDGDGHIDLNATLRGGMSASNTAPEDLGYQDYSVSEKTDVYSLGMMLAGMFLLVDGKYTQPSEKWVYRNGWKQDPITKVVSCDTVALINGFSKCQSKYESGAKWDSTWIEQDLTARGIRCQWERMPDHNLLKLIRSAFFSATRIDPKDRLTLDQFIKTLEILIQRAKNSSSRIPVSVYLVDQNKLDQFRTLYADAACKVFRQETDDAIRLGQEPPMALCVAHRRGLDIDSSHRDATKLLTDPPVSDDGDLRKVILGCSMANGTNADMTLCALLTACVFLGENQDTYRFTGNIHLFAEEVPAMDQMKPLLSGGHYVDINAFRSIMLQQFRLDTLSIYAHTLRESGAYHEDVPWFQPVPLEVPKAKKAKWGTKQDGPVDQGPAPDPEPTPQPATGSGEKPSTSYVMVGDKKIYLRKRNK